MLIGWLLRKSHRFHTSPYIRFRIATCRWQLYIAGKYHMFTPHISLKNTYSWWWHEPLETKCWSKRAVHLIRLQERIGHHHMTTYILRGNKLIDSLRSTWLTTTHDTWANLYPYHPYMVYLPTFGWCLNVGTGKYDSPMVWYGICKWEFQPRYLSFNKPWSQPFVLSF